MRGTLTELGIGPGDPELLTLKAVRLIREADVVAFPGKVPQETVAYKIVKGAVPEIDEKELVGIEFPMTKDKELLRRSHEAGAATLMKLLDEGKTVVCPTLGDPTIYATVMYPHRIIQEAGYETAIVPGVPSFCACAARLNTSLVEQAEELHVIPSSYGVEEALELPGTKVLMKAGKKFGSVINTVMQKGQKMTIVENCGMDNEKIYYDPTEATDLGYYTLMIVKSPAEK